MRYPPETISKLESKTKEIRRLIVEMLFKAGSGHPGGSLSATELLVSLFYEVIKADPKKSNSPDRDRFHLSKGHCCPLVYAILADLNFFNKEELWKLRKLGALLQGHPDARTPGIEVPSGSLGQGLSVALGMSLAGRLDKRDYRVYCLMGDGEIQEGSIWEAAMAATHYKCDNLCAMLDYNGFQIDGAVSQVMNLEPIVEKWKAFGWHTISIDGHDIPQVLNAYEEASTIKGKPTIIIAKTTKGKGVSFMENVVNFHGCAPNDDETQKALKELEL